MNAIVTVDNKSKIFTQQFTVIGLQPEIYVNKWFSIPAVGQLGLQFACVISLRFLPMPLDLGSIIIEDNVLIAPKVSLLSERHPVSPVDRQSLTPRGMFISKRKHGLAQITTILSGITVGENAVITTEAVVSKDVPYNAIVSGVPAKTIRIIQNVRPAEYG
jgi:acetyltransferase-like isoleucine patch superfamily enzyme